MHGRLGGRCALWIFGVLLAGSAPVAASTPEGETSKEPYLSVRTGLSCSQCHTNRTGGGGRNQFGSVYAQAFLPWQKRSFQGRSLNRFLSVGGDIRLAASGTASGSSPRTTLAVTEANIQVEARLVPDALAVYVDQTIGPGGAGSREVFALLEGLPLDGYAKAGKFLLPFGLRLLDDQEFIRERTGFSYKTPDIGWEVGIEPGPLSLFLAVTNGTQGGDENNSAKQVTATSALIFRHFRLGVSASRNNGADARREVLGGFGGLNLGRLTLLGELDLIVDSPEDGDELEQLAAYVEANLLATRGLNAKVTYGFLDPNTDVGENARTRMRFGLEWFPIPFLQLSAFYALLEDIPQSTTDLDQLSLELHAYF